MIKFFRQIRQTSLLRGKTAKYLFYAVGEIVLVVIGILIALQINNSNQERQTRKKEKVYLQSLQSEFKNNLELLEIETKRNKNNREAAIAIANQIDNQNPDFTSQDLSKLIGGSFAYDVEYKPVSAVLNELVSSGSMKDIRNQELKTALANWESVLGKVKGQERLLINDRNLAINRIREIASFRGIFDDIGNSTDRMGMDEGKRDFDNLHLLDSRAFENDLMLFIATNESTGHDIYRSAERSIIRILDLIKKELEEK